MQLKTASTEDIERIKEVYVEAFPRSERKPFSIIEKNAEKGKMEILSIYDKEFCGLVITANYSDIVLVDYFAVSESSRGNGVGSTVIPLIRNRYKDKKLFLEIELANPNASFDEQKSRRKRFYLKNGLKCADINVSLFGVPMEILTFGNDISVNDCKRLYRSLYGRMYRMFIRFK